MRHNPQQKNARRKKRDKRETDNRQGSFHAWPNVAISCCRSRGRVADTGLTVSKLGREMFQNKLSDSGFDLVSNLFRRQSVSLALTVCLTGTSVCMSHQNGQIFTAIVELLVSA